MSTKTRETVEELAAPPLLPDEVARLPYLSTTEEMPEQTAAALAQRRLYVAGVAPKTNRVDDGRGRTGAVPRSGLGRSPRPGGSFRGSGMCPIPSPSFWHIQPPAGPSGDSVMGIRHRAVTVASRVGSDGRVWRLVPPEADLRSHPAR